MLLTFAFSLVGFAKALAFSHKLNKLNELSFLSVSCVCSLLDIITGRSARALLGRVTTDDEPLLL